MKRLLAVIAFFSAFVATQAGAASLSLGYSGVFSADSTLGGVAFGADTPFTFQATFDSTTRPDWTNASSSCNAETDMLRAATAFPVSRASSAASSFAPSEWPSPVEKRPSFVKSAICPARAFA